MIVEIIKSKANGTIFAPPSKSAAHRHIIASALAKGQSIVHNVETSNDILATLDCISALGASYKIEGSDVIINGIDIKNRNNDAILKCRESGSTLRFFIPLCLLSNYEATLYGTEKLISRPLDIYEEICKNQNLEFIKSSDNVKVKGKISSGIYEVKGNISSQFITGLLYALPLLDKKSIIKIIPPFESRSYINLTISILKEYGIKVYFVDEYTIEIEGNGTYQNRNLTVEGDYSNAAFFEALNHASSIVKVEGLLTHSTQGDKVYIEYFDKLKKENATLNIEDCPDLGPILFVVAALNNGATFTGTRRLRIKESDRAICMKEELSKFGLDIIVKENEVIVPKATLHKPNVVLNSHNDHRIVMSLAVLLTLFGGEIEDAEAVNKSFPSFFGKLESLGIGIKIK